MVKKKKFSYKGLKVNEEELSITKIGEMPNEDKSPIFLFFVFGIFIAFVFFLPDVVNYFSKENMIIATDPATKEENKNPEENIQNELVYYDLSSNLVVDLEEGIKVDNFKIANNTLSFRISNSGVSKFYFSKYNYFIELYTEDSTLLERIILSKESIAKDNSKDFSYPIFSTTLTNAKKIVFVEKQLEDYPNITLSKNEAEEDVLVCVRDYETIIYSFKDEKLITIADEINYTRSGSELSYQNDLALWQTRVTNYNNINGVSSSFISNDTGFKVNTILDLKNVKITSIDNENYYAHETLAKVVNFEMEARGFSCN